MASAHWVADIATRVDPPLLEQFMGAVKQAAADSEFGLASEANTRIECIDSACASAPDPRLARGFASLDAAAFFDAAQAPGTAFSRDEDSGRRLSNARREIEKAASIGDPKPYYALVAVDGDSVGSLLGDHAVRTSVAAAISSFADSAVEAVRHCNGFLIYAGGDDVLALLPSQDAFTCAVKLRSAYETAFADAGIPGASTLSAGIVYAHTGVSLGAVIAEAHRQLETVAKQQTGRDAVAVAVCKPGATTVEWSQPWHAALDADGRVVVEVLAHGLLNESEYTTTFLARFCDLVGMLQPPGSSSAALSAAEQDRLTAALLLGSSASLPGVPREVIEGRAAQLVSQCRIRHRETTASQPRISETGEIAVDAALLVRYLVSHGGESS
jgi:CRISPR-associated protein Cmr2